MHAKYRVFWRCSNSNIKKTILFVNLHSFFVFWQRKHPAFIERQTFWTSMVPYVVETWKLMVSKFMMTVDRQCSSILNSIFPSWNLAKSFSITVQSTTKKKRWLLKQDLHDLQNLRMLTTTSVSDPWSIASWNSETHFGHTIMQPKTPYQQI